MVSDAILFILGLFILFGSIFITFKSKFIQFRFLRDLFKILKIKKVEEGSHTILPHKALFTAMSTTLGIGTIVGPVIAMHLGGPGALLGFLLTAFFGSAATYSEVTLSLHHRKKVESGAILGGPMPYMKALLSPTWAKWYAIFGSLMMAGWSAAQANQLVVILDSPLLGAYSTPTIVSGAVISVAVFFILMGGIKRIGSLSSKLVPLMFVLFVGSAFWILFSNIEKLGDALKLIFQSAFTPYALASGGVVGGLVEALRWGIFRGIHATEAGVGTQSIPHSMAETQDPHAQGILAMVTTFTSGVVAFISGCVAIVTHTFEDGSLPLGISMVAASFQLYFSEIGVAIVTISTVLFAFGTILGNSYNGSQCYSYLTNNKSVILYFFATAIAIFLGAICETKTIWSLIDFGLVFLVVPHMMALILHTLKRPVIAQI